jgi:hypothetical protein
MSVDPRTFLDKVYGDPLEAINGLLTEMRPFLEADLQTVRLAGIESAPAPVVIVDPELENRLAYGLDAAIRFAMLIAPAVTVSLHHNSDMTQMCIPVLTGRGLDELGTTVVERGELMLRAFMLVVHRVFMEITYADESESFRLFARTHKAESVEIGGERWYSKACNSDREAVGMVDTLLTGSKRTQVYCYLGGGGLTDASTSYAALAQGVVCRTKSWAQCSAVCIAVSLLTAAVPGRSAILQEEFCSIDCPEEEAAEGDMLPPGQGTCTTPERVARFVAFHKVKELLVWKRAGLSFALLEPSYKKSVEEARTAMEKLREFLSREPIPMGMFSPPDPPPPPEPVFQ